VKQWKMQIDRQNLWDCTYIGADWGDAWQVACLTSEAGASPRTVYVPDDYPTIQATVNAASPGDTIIVYPGTYTENVDVNKSLTIKIRERN
jgi:pectin methylesterase-like acyl-CoA thioesterase